MQNALGGNDRATRRRRFVYPCRMEEFARAELAANGAAEPRYRRLRRLGEGSMGVVFEAQDMLLQRKVALKALRAENAELSYRLKREFRSLVGLSHRNLVQLYELGTDATGYFFTMELVEGVDFLSYCTSEAPPFAGSGQRSQPASAIPALGYDMERLRRALGELALGLGALHAQGFVHRDIKPSNVLVARNGRVVLIDFGLIADGAESEASGGSAQLVGTSAYMAPEQLAAEPLRASADLYAVGVMLFEVLTGRRPFEGKLLDVLQQKALREAPDVRVLAPSAPEDLARLCMRLLERDPARRAGVRELAEVVGQSLEVLPSPASPPSSRSKLVGRGQELGALQAAFEQVRAGACRVVLVGGPSGIGKSALVREFLEHLAAAVPRVTILSGRCYEAESIPFKAVDGLMDALSELWRRLPLAEAMYLMPREPEFLVRAFPVLLRVPAVGDKLATAAALPAAEALRRSFCACRETFQRLGRSGPLVLWLDDVQWADPDSIRLLVHLLDPVDAPGILLILSQRLDGAHESAALEAITKQAQRIALGPIEPEHMRELLQSILGAASEELVNELTREASGSPFLGSTLARYARQHPGSSSSSLQLVLAERLHALSSDARALLSLIALAAGPLSPELSARALESDRSRVDSNLRELAAWDLVRLAPGGQERRIEPYHDKIRQVVLGTLDETTRARQHLAIALALEEETEVDSGACARHFLAAGEAAKACLHARRAGKRAELQLAFMRAAEHYRVCLDLAQLAPEDARSLRRDLANALSNAGRGPQAAEEYLALARSSDGDDKLDLEQRAAEEYLRAGYPDLGLRSLRAVLSQVGLGYPKSSQRALLAGLAQQALARLRLRKHLQAGAAPGAAAADAAALRRIDVCRTVANCLAFLEPEVTFYYQRTQLRLALDNGEPARLCRALAMEATYRALGGKVDATTGRLLRRAGELASEISDPQVLAVVRLHEGMVVYYQGRWQTAFEHCSVAADALERSGVGAHWELANAMLYVLLSLLTRGDLNELRRRLQRELAQAEARRDMFALTILRAGALHLVRLGDDEPGQIEQDLNSVMGMWAKQQFSVPRFWELLALTNRDLYLGEFERAFQRFEPWPGLLARSLPMRVQVTRVKVHHARARAALALAVRGQPERLAIVEQEIAVLESEGVAWASGLARSLRGGVAFARADREGCLRALRQAERELGQAELWLDAWSVARLRAELEPPSEGQDLRAACAEWFSRHGVRNPDALARVHAPALT